jgi:hypothetical protein
MPPDAVPADEPNREEKLEEVPSDDQTTPFRPADNATYQDDHSAMSVKSLDLNGDEVEEDGQIPHDTTVVQPDIGDISSTHPQTDTNLERSEYYDEGISGAAEAGEPNAGSEVTGYHKPEDDDDGQTA